MEKLFIKNRKDQKVSVLVEENKNQKGLVFIMHGLGGDKEQLHIKIYAEAFKENSFTVIRVDTTNTFGESDGKYEDATTTNYYEDLVDVLKWAKSQKWYTEPFWLAGHILGSSCTAWYAENNSQNVVAIAPTSALISRKLKLETMTKEEVENWRKTGWIEKRSATNPKITKKLKWTFVTDGLNYSLLDKAEKLTMPVLLIVGDQDEGTPIKHQQLFFDKLTGKKELHIIKGAGHTFREKQHLEEIKVIMDKWIKKYL